MKNALKSVKYPGFTRDIVSFGLVKSIQIDNGDVKVQLALATNDPNIPATIKNDAERALRTIEGIRSAKVLIDIHAPPGGAGARCSHHADSGRQTRYRGGQRQRWRGQINRRGKSCGGTGANRRARRSV